MMYVVSENRVHVQISFAEKNGLQGVNGYLTRHNGNPSRPRHGEVAEEMPAQGERYPKVTRQDERFQHLVRAAADAMLPGRQHAGDEVFGVILFAVQLAGRE
jgi:hypothetical protein